MSEALSRAIRSSGGRIVSALAARFRDLTVAEDAFAAACLKALEHEASADDMVAWLYRTAERCALDMARRSKVRRHARVPEPSPEPNAEDLLVRGEHLVPDERLRLLFVCCHPAIAADARAPLALRVVLGLTTTEIARAFLVPEATLAQRLVRAKRKIAEARISFELPAPDQWAERLEAVLSSIEVAYAKAHEDAAGTAPHAPFADEMRTLAALLADLLPDDPDVLALAATIHYAEARRPARVDGRGRMVPLSEQDPALWSRERIERGHGYLRRAAALHARCARELEAAIHGVWCARASLEAPPPWPTVLQLYDLLLEWRSDAVVRVNRAVALAEVAGADVALAEIEALDRREVAELVTYHVVRADLLRRCGRREEARAAYTHALGYGVAKAERLWIEERIAGLGVSG